MNVFSIILLFVILVISKKNDKIMTLNEDFVENPHLGRNEEVVILVKDFLQSHRVRRAKRERSRHDIGRTSPRLLSRGMVVGIKLDKDEIRTVDSDWKYGRIEPFHLDFFEERVIISGGNLLEEIDLEMSVLRRFENEWFSQLHTAVYNERGNKCLLVSSGFDLVIEYDLLKEEILRDWSAWENGFEKNKRGIYLTRERKRYEELESKRMRNIYIENPSEIEFKRNQIVKFGIPVGQRCCHTNNAFYINDTTFGITMGIRDMALFVDWKTGESTPVIKNIHFPHSFSPQERATPCKGYVIVDSVRGNVVFLDEEFNVCEKVSVTKTKSKFLSREKHDVTITLRGLNREWVQYATHLHDDLYSVVDARSVCIYLVDMKTREYRVIPYERDLSIQEVLKTPNHEIYSKLGKFFSRDDKHEFNNDREIFELHSNVKEEGMKQMTLTENELVDLYMIGVGGYNPLSGFMGEDDFNCVLETMRLCSGELWTIPIIKSISKEEKENFQVGDEVQLVYDEGDSGRKIHGLLTIESIYTHDRTRHSYWVYRSSDQDKHRGVKHVIGEMKEYLVGGNISLVVDGGNLLQMDFETPRQVRNLISDLGWDDIITCHSKPESKPIITEGEGISKESLLFHRFELKEKRDVLEVDMSGKTTTVTNSKLSPFKPLSFPYWTRYCGERESIFNTIILRNYGCSKIVLERDSFSPTKEFYNHNEEKKLIKKYSRELGVQVSFNNSF